MYPDDFLLPRLLYRDALMLIIDKPAGIPVHKGSGGGDNLERYFEALRFGLPNPPALAHRLDRETSGCLVLGRNRHALKTLGNCFASGTVIKTYWAIVSGAPPQSEGTVDLKLAKQSADPRRWHMKVDDNGQEAVTGYRTLGSANGMSWLELKPRTGRTHQLRVHMQAIGCPILGDKIYGGDASHKLMLHARAVTVPLYPKKPPIAAEAPAPEEMAKLLAGVREGEVR